MAGAIAAGAVVVVGCIHRIGREELVDRERHAAEQAAGILLRVAGALGLRHAVVIHGDEQLGIPLQPHQCELPQQLYPTYQGAVVVCEGAGSSTVRLAVVNAVSVLTGLSSDKISVVKWKS